MIIWLYSSPFWYFVCSESVPFQRARKCLFDVAQKYPGQDNVPLKTHSWQSCNLTNYLATFWVLEKFDGIKWNFDLNFSQKRSYLNIQEITHVLLFKIRQWMYLLKANTYIISKQSLRHVIQSFRGSRRIS